MRRQQTSLLVLLAACSPDSADTTADTDSDPAVGPAPGAPDEHCELDPEAIYVVARDELLDYYALTNLDDPSIVCALGRWLEMVLISTTQVRRT